MKRGRLNLNKTGYTKGTPTEDNSYNIIPSNRISMKNVDKNIMAFPVDSKGKIMDTVVMKPGEEKLFKGAEYVIETPEKPKLVAGAAAAALGAKAGTAAAAGAKGGLLSGSSLKGLIGSDAKSMIMNNPDLLNKAKEKQDTMKNNSAFIGGMGYQNLMMYGGTKDSDTDKKPKLQAGKSGQDVLDMDLDEVFGNQDFDLDPSVVPYMDVPNTQTEYGETTGMTIESDLNTRMADSPLIDQDWQNYDDFTQKPTSTQKSDNNTNRVVDEDTNNEKSNNNKNSEDSNKESDDSNNEGLDLSEDEKNILNPYGGVDIPTAFNKFGAAIEAGDTPTAIAAGAKSLLGAARNIGTGMGLQRRAEKIQEGELEDQKDEIKGEYKKGGKASEILTGDYSAEEKGKANAEAEGGEYRKDENNNVTEIKGNKHEQGGVDISLEKKEEILTDHTKLKGGIAKEIRDNFNIDVKAKNTYSDVIDKYRTKSGIKKLSKEEEKVIEKLDKVIQKLKKDPEDNTQQLNKQFLQNKINEINKKKEPLKQKETQLFSYLFNKQESQKKENSDNITKSKLVQKLKESNGLSDDDAEQAIKADLGISGLDIEAINKALELYEGIPQEAIDQAMENDPSLTVDEAKAKVVENNPEIEKLKQKQRLKEIRREKLKPYYSIPNIEISESVLDLTDKDFNKKLEEFEKIKQQYLEQKRKKEQEEKEDDTQENYLPNLPNQMPLPPRGMQAHLMTDFDAERIDAPYIDPTTAISEARRSEMQMEEQLRGLPASQRVAVMANITAQTQNQKNKILSDINRANMESQMKARQANAQASDKEELMDQKAALSYEKRQMTADAKTEANLRGFYNHLNDLNTVNYNTIQNMNLANQLSDDYFYNTQTGKVEQATNQKLSDTKRGRKK